MPADPVVSPADTIRQLRLRVERKYANECAEQRNSGHGRDVESWLASVSYREWFVLTDALDALLAVGERDRRHIARLTAALEMVSEFAGQFTRFHTGFVHIVRMVAAVLADEEDAE